MFLTFVKNAGDASITDANQTKKTHFRQLLIVHSVLDFIG